MTTDPFTEADVKRAEMAIIDAALMTANPDNRARLYARAVFASLSLDRMEAILTEAGRLTEDEAEERETHFTTVGWHPASACEGYPECTQKEPT